MHWSTLQDFSDHGLDGGAWTGRDTQVAACLDAANETILGYFRTAPGITLPVAAGQVTTDMIKNECWLAAYGFMSARGFDPSSDPDAVISDRHAKAMAWLRDVAKGLVKPFETAAETTDPDDIDDNSSSAGVVSDLPRRWTVFG